VRKAASELGGATLPDWETSRVNLPRDGSRSMQKFWAEYHERLNSVRKSGALHKSGMAANPDCGFKVLHPPRQPVWGKMLMVIAVTCRRICHGDGHARAERREAAWYHFR
jgi:hypothetical protein